ncbi:MAG: inorganic phosphate transporter [Victivallales bacterium]|jgi:PiT family inorganic phosphate transporter
MFSHFVQYLGCLFMGWGLGANDSANVFGTAVSSRMVSYRLAIWLTALFVMIGAVCDGERGISTLSHELRKDTTFTGPGAQDQEKADRKARRTAIVVSFSAALAVILLTVMKLPISTSQAVVGSIAGVGILQHSLNIGSLTKIIICWIGTPVGGMLFTLVFYYIFRAVIRKLNMSVFVYDPAMSMLLIVTGCYGAYALGANNVANVSAIFVGHNMLTVKEAAVFGGITIAFGVLTYAKPVMMTVGKSIVNLDAFSAFTCVFSQALTVHIYAIIGVPVSTTQAIIGAILGIGVIKGGQTINFRKLTQVSIGWLATPLIAALLASLMYFIANLHYLPD